MHLTKLENWMFVFPNADTTRLTARQWALPGARWSEDEQVSELSVTSDVSAGAKVVANVSPLARCWLCFIPVPN
jgi:hypothetical protein